MVGLLISTRMQQSGETDDFLSVYWLYFAVSLTIPVCGCIMPEVRFLKGIGRKHTIDELQLSSGLTPIVAVKSGSTLETRQSAEEQYHAPVFETICRKSTFYPLYVVLLSALSTLYVFSWSILC